MFSGEGAMIDEAQRLLEPIKRLHERLRERIVAECERVALEELSRVVADEVAGDTIYAIDRVGEEALICGFSEIARDAPLVLIAEGIGGGAVVLPSGAREEEAVWRIIVDPVDGTRSLMYQKRSAWVLTGVAPNRGAQTSLRDIVLAVQTEIPTLKQHLGDVLWAVRGRGAQAERWNRLTGERTPLRLQPSRATTIRHGYAYVARFFPGARDELAAIDEEIVREALGPVQPGKAHCFEDQYPSTGGQLYELVMGHDRFIADLRPLMARRLRARGLLLGICCHPYDLCTELIAREAGAIITGPDGCALDAPLTVEADVAWVGYANAAIRAEIEPLLQRALARRGLLEKG
ncbi:inositol monophosphatase [Pyrinomonas sp.]|uniref:inositol monophosphatase n=1 Tax=Pyrinomonas sp. TaxID=2080306 RepID=UPI00332E7A50